MNHPKYPICERASARICGNRDFPNLRGIVHFQQRQNGVLLMAEICGLPDDGPDKPNIFAFHIHEGDCTSQDSQNPFHQTGGHWNPHQRMHPCHAGDLPPLFGCKGYAYLTVLTNRFMLKEVLGRAIVIHRDPDDFTTQPSGNAGAKIACGVIRAR